MRGQSRFSKWPLSVRWPPRSGSKKSTLIHQRQNTEWCVCASRRPVQRRLGCVLPGTVKKRRWRHAPRATAGTDSFVLKPRRCHQRLDSNGINTPCAHVSRDDRSGAPESRCCSAALVNKKGWRLPGSVPLSARPFREGETSAAGPCGGGGVVAWLLESSGRSLLVC